ncbi:uncharacterized protein LOC108599220 [Drosophila busckii]|uniref:uncharacterized protein LOC108599220 n=1 Tax=Drosophila busckii TaxID=30019 RepID=UPI00083F408E|nr:uncharacterized protein LOC108599220 [Drosophila busckii]
MNKIIYGIALMVLISEGFSAARILIELCTHLRFIKLELDNMMWLLVQLLQLVGFGLLAIGVIKRYRLLLQVWLLFAYAQIKWISMLQLLISVYAYMFSNKYETKQEFQQEFTNKYAPLIEQVLRRLGNILMIYRYYKDLEPSKAPIQVAQLAAKLKIK